MASLETVRRAALSQPEAYEDSHRRAPAFRVRNRIFGMLRDEPPRLILKLEREDQLNMIEGHPDIVVPGAHYAHHGWTVVHYPAADAALIETLIQLAWAHVAPRGLVKARRT